MEQRDSKKFGSRKNKASPSSPPLPSPPLPFPSLGFGSRGWAAGLGCLAEGARFRIQPLGAKPGAPWAWTQAGFKVTIGKQGCGHT